MTVRAILVPLFGGTPDAASLQAALGLARRFGAHVNGLFVRIDPTDVIPVIDEGVSPAVIDQLIQGAAAEMNRQSQAARAAFETACRAAGITIADAPGEVGTASAGWIELTGRRDELIPRKARVSDLTVLRRPDDQAPPELNPVLEATLFGAGRPLLILPPPEMQSVGQTIAIAWNGSAEAARAVGWALPFLEGTGAVHVLTAESWRTSADVALDLAEYLAWRGIGCAPRVVTPAEDETLGGALLRTAAEVGADLLVMGGYGRSKLSELVLGGVTRHVLAEAELPVLISH